jgi:anti-anti-sigma regulatory factor
VTTRRRTKAAAKQTPVESPQDAVADPVTDAAEAAPAAAAPLAEAVAAPPAAGGPVRLEGPVLIRKAAELSARLREALAAGRLQIDAGGVTQVDTATLQLFVAAVATARRDGAAVEWLAVSPALQDGARRLGLAAPLALPAAG